MLIPTAHQTPGAPTSRLSAPVAVVASAALIASVGASSYAAGTMITGKDIKNGTVQVKDLSPKAVKALRGATGATGATGAPGAAGTAGATEGQGIRGASAFEPVPSGTTIKGGWYVDADATVVDQDFGAAVPLSGVASADLTWNINVFFAPHPATDNGTESALCTGTAVNPTAPAGKLCVYTTNYQSATVKPFAILNTRNTFGLYVDATATGDIYAQGTWAYTAP